MEKNTKFFLDPIPDTNQYLITEVVNGEIKQVAVRTTEYLIEKWGNQHINSTIIVQGLKDHYQIELYE